MMGGVQISLLRVARLDFMSTQPTTVIFSLLDPDFSTQFYVSSLLQTCVEEFSLYGISDNFAKVRILIKLDEAGNTSYNVNREELEAWWSGMKAMAAIPHVHVKLSMLGYAVPVWLRPSARMQF